MPRKAKIKIGDRISIKNKKDLFGVVVWQRPDGDFDVHLDVVVNKSVHNFARLTRCIAKADEIEKVKPLVKIEEEVITEDD